MSKLPVIDISALIEEGPGAGHDQVAAEIRAACRDCGFFYVVGHGVDQDRIEALRHESRRFFALPTQRKRDIEMALAGRSWRGYFGVGDELTSGKPDWKEGLYFGSELGPDDARVARGVPLHGANLFPEAVPGLRTAVLDYIDCMTTLGHRLMSGFALGLGLEAETFRRDLTADPLLLFRIFHYPEMGPQQIEEALWSVGEHTDYGLITVLLQDDVGGLEVKSGGEWVAAPPIAGSFICNLGDMLERMTGGFYRSTPHRVLNRSGRSRYSFPFFFDPGWDAKVRPVPPSAELASAELASAEVASNAGDRWDGASVHEFEGTYGEYILAKVGKVFPDLAGGS